MKSLAVNGYTAAAVLDQIRGVFGKREWAFRYQLLSKTGAILGDLTNVKEGSGSIRHDSEAVIKRTGKFTLVEDGSIDYYSNRVKPWIRIKMPDGGWAEWPLGVFLLTTPTKGIDVASVIARDVDAYDMTIVLQDDTVTDRYFVGSGAKYTDAIIELLSNTSGIWTWNVTPSLATLPAAKEWDPGTLKYDIIKDLINSISYNDIWFDGNGVAQVTPYVDPNDRTAEFDYSTDATSVMLPDAEQTLDLFGRANSWVFFVSNPDQTPLRVTRVNASVDSPTSTVNRGRTITKMVQVDAAPDLFVLGQIADQKVLEETLVFETVKFRTGLMPMHENIDMYTFDYTTLAPSGKYFEVSWDMQLNAGTTMNHVARRAVQIL